MRSRAYRRHQRARVKARHLRAYYVLSATWPDVRFGFPPRKDIATRHPLDCGRRCYLCHYDKLLGFRPRREAADWRSYEALASGN